MVLVSRQERYLRPQHPANAEKQARSGRRTGLATKPLHPRQD
jgi:hypothetical protein